jgi:L-lactate dehydrogenase complex protein LldG
MISSREVILNKITDAKQNFELQPVTEKRAIYREVGNDLLNCFKTELEAVNGYVGICNSFSDAVDQLNQFLVQNNIEDLLCFDEKLTKLLSKISGISTTSQLTYNTSASVTNCEALVARTGSVVMSSTLDCGRKAYAYCPVHIVVAYNSQIVEYLDDAIVFLKEKYSEDLPSSITIVTGPSRTADIEKTLVLGAHGPKSLAVFVIK